MEEFVDAFLSHNTVSLDGMNLVTAIEFALLVAGCVLGVLALKSIAFRLAMTVAARVVRRRGQNNRHDEDLN
jgi:hypothetical protein